MSTGVFPIPLAEVEEEVLCSLTHTADNFKSKRELAELECTVLKSDITLSCSVRINN